MNFVVGDVVRRCSDKLFIGYWADHCHYKAIPIRGEYKVLSVSEDGRSIVLEGVDSSGWLSVFFEHVKPVKLEDML